MAANRLFKLPLDPEKLDAVRDHFASLEDRRETVERGLALERMNAETAWLDEAEPALYYLHDESEEYPPAIDLEDVEDEALLELSATHHAFFQEVAAADHDHPDDLEPFEELFHASARDRI
jgi:hypothetical protein